MTTQSQGQVRLVRGHVGISGKGASGLQPLQPTRTFSGLSVANGGEKGTFQAPMDWWQGQLGRGWLCIDWKLSLGPAGTAPQA